MKTSYNAALFTTFVLTASSWAATPRFNGIPRDLPVQGTSNPVAVGDFNGDGRFDFAETVTLDSDSVLVIALGSAKGGYTYAEKLLLGFPGGVAAVDVNGDGKLDLIVVGDHIQVFLGSGDGTFAAPIDTSIGDNASSLAVADFNGDGKLDVALSITTGVKLFWGNGGGTFETGTLLPGESFLSIATADFNRDSIPDLVVAGDTLSVYLGLGQGRFQQVMSVPPAGSASGRPPAIADFNGDGIPDVALSFANNAETGVQVFLGASDGTLQAATTMPATSHSQLPGVTAGDFNGDGKPDLVELLTLFIPDTNPVFAITVLPGNGDGTFGAGASIPAGTQPVAAVPVYSNEDHALDLIVSDFPQHGGSIYGISILHGLGNGSFEQAPEIRNEKGAGTYAVAAGDFNGDGLPDVITANSGTSDLSVFLNQGGSSLESPIDTQVGRRAELLAVGDLNNDGKLDVVVAGRDSLDASVLLGKGDGTFLPPLTVPLGMARHPVQIAMADLNGDGNLDLVAIGYGTEDVYVYFGLGNGSFGPPVTLTGDVSAYYLVIGDVNGDGYPDIVTFQEGGFLGEFLSKSNGTFSPYINLQQGGGGLNGLTLADINGDGKLDVIYLSSPIAVSLGNGDGTFGPVTYPSGYYFDGSALALADFNGDGKLDIAVQCAAFNSVVVLAGNGDGTFEDVGSYAGRFSETGITTADFKGSGRPDIISSETSGISILPNVTP